MKVFCYDLTLGQLFSSYGSEPGFLVHDSTFFGGVDESQVAKALELAANELEAQEIQYICSLNSDNVAYDDFSETFKTGLGKHEIITFTDTTDDGGLLGIKILNKMPLKENIS